MSDEDFVDHVEHANSKFLWHWFEPWGGVQSGPGVGEPLLPSRLHCRAAELEILYGALGLHRAVDELHDIHLSHTAVHIESSVLARSGGSNLWSSLIACRTSCFSRNISVVNIVRLE
jgi:hypothetical protein